MLTIKHIESSGHESVRQVREVTFQPSHANGTNLLAIVFGYDSPGYDGALQYGDGKIFVMNEFGKTVATYDLDTINRFYIGPE